MSDKIEKASEALSRIHDEIEAIIIIRILGCDNPAVGTLTESLAVIEESAEELHNQFSATIHDSWVDAKNLSSKMFKKVLNTEDVIK